MDRLLHPVGPEPVAVYWRRRAAVLAGLIVLIVILVLIVKALTAPSQDQQATPTPPVTVSPTAPTTPAIPPACTDANFLGAQLTDGADIDLSPEKPSFPAGEPILLRAKVKNMAAEDCSLLINPHNVVVNVVSGSDPIFNSSHCASTVAEDAGDLTTIKAGETVEIPISWDGTRSQQGCPEITTKPGRSSDATYKATVTIVGVVSKQTRFLLVP